MRHPVCVYILSSLLTCLFTCFILITYQPFYLSQYRSVLFDVGFYLRLSVCVDIFSHVCLFTCLLIRLFLLPACLYFCLFLSSILCLVCLVCLCVSLICFFFLIALFFVCTSVFCFFFIYLFILLSFFPCLLLSSFFFLLSFSIFYPFILLSFFLSLFLSLFLLLSISPFLLFFFLLFTCPFTSSAYLFIQLSVYLVHLPLCPVYPPLTLSSMNTCLPMLVCLSPRVYPRVCVYECMHVLRTLVTAYCAEVKLG